MDQGQGDPLRQVSEGGSVVTFSGPDITDLARHRWRSLLPLFGVDARFLVDKSGPCPVCEGRTRFRFDDKNGDGTSFCNHCRARSGMQLVQAVNGWTFAEAAKHVRAHLGDVQIQVAQPKKRDDAAAKKRMNEAWLSAKPITAETSAGLYLDRRVRPGPYPADLRAASSLFCQEQGDQPRCSRPAMLALVRAADGKPSALHRTYLTADGQKAPLENPKLSWGDLPAGVAVRLTPIAQTLGIAEGIETALASTARTGIPCWAALNAGRLEAWWPPAGVEQVVIFADNDASFVGQRAAITLGERLVKADIGATIMTPPATGTDWADVWDTERQASAA